MYAPQGMAHSNQQALPVRQGQPHPSETVQLYWTPVSDRVQSTGKVVWDNIKSDDFKHENDIRRPHKTRSGG